MALRQQVEEAVGQLILALRDDAAGDPVPGYLAAVLEAAAALRALEPEAAADRLADVRAALAGERACPPVAAPTAAEPEASGSDGGEAASDGGEAASDGGEAASDGGEAASDGGEAASDGGEPQPEAVVPALPADALPLQRELAALAGELESLGQGLLLTTPTESLIGLATARVPAGAAGAEFYVAAVVLLDQIQDSARYLPCEAAVRARIEGLVDEAAREAEAVGARIYPRPGPADVPGELEELPAFGAVGELVAVERHGFVLAGTHQAARVRRGVGPAPDYVQPLVDGYALLVARRDRLADGLKTIKSFRGWLDGLAGESAEDRATTVRFAVTALFALTGLGLQAAYDRALRAAEGVGLFAIPFDPARLHDLKRYELLPQKGAGDPHVVRPGFQGGDGMIMQRARVVGDPERIG